MKKIEVEVENISWGCAVIENYTLQFNKIHILKEEQQFLFPIIYVLIILFVDFQMCGGC